MFSRERVAFHIHDWTWFLPSTVQIQSTAMRDRAGFLNDEELHHVTVLLWRKQVGCLFHVKQGSQSLNELKFYFKFVHRLPWSCWPFSPDISGAKQDEKPDSQWKWDFCLWFKLSLVKQIQHWRPCHVKRIYLTLVGTSFIALYSLLELGMWTICVFRSLPFHLLQT